MADAEARVEGADQEGAAKFRRLLWASVAAANLAVSAMAVALLSLSWSQFDRGASQQARSRLEGMSQAVEMRVERFRVGQKVLVEELERQLARDEPDKERIDKLIARLNAVDEVNGESYALRVVDEHGMLVNGWGSGERPPINYADRAYFQELKSNPEKGYVMSGLLLGRVSKLPSVAFAMPYKKPDGSFGGIVLAAVAQRSLLALAAPYRVAPDDMVAMRSARDLEMLAMEPQSEWARFPSVPSKVKRLLEQGHWEGSMVDDRRDRSEGGRSVAYAVSKRAPLFMVVGVGRQTHFGPWRSQAWTAGAFCALFMLMSWGLAARLGRYERRTRRAKEDYRELSGRLELEVESRTADLSEALDRVKRGRDELAEAERLASLGAMVATVAHELNTPLGNALLSNTAITEQARALARALDPGAEGLKRSELAHGLERLGSLSEVQARSIERAAELVRSFKQVAVDQTSERRRVFDLRSAIEDVVSSLGPLLRRNGFPMSIQVDVPEGIECESYPGALGQIAINVIQNAQIHAFEGRERGALRIGARAWTERAEEMVELAFEDDGVGMSPEAQARIFDLFYTSKASGGGSGIGLALARKLAESALGGSMTASSQQGKGSQFVVSFPRRRR